MPGTIRQHRCITLVVLIQPSRGKSGKMGSAFLRPRALAAAVLRGGEAAATVSIFCSRSFASLATGTDIVSTAEGATLQKARSWDEGVSSKFSTTPINEIFKGKKVVIFGLPGAFTGVCSQQHVPSYMNNFEKLKAKGIDSVVCVAVNDPYALNGWAEKIQAKEAIDFYGDFDGSFHKSLELDVDLSSALLGHRSHRWSAYVVDGKVQALNVEKKPSDFVVSAAEGTSEQQNIGKIMFWKMASSEDASAAPPPPPLCMTLEPQIGLEILSDLTNQPLKRQLLTPPGVGAKSYSSRAVAMGLLDTSGGRGGAAPRRRVRFPEGVEEGIRRNTRDGENKGVCT